MSRPSPANWTDSQAAEASRTGAIAIRPAAMPASRPSGRTGSGPTVIRSRSSGAVLGGQVGDALRVDRHALAGAGVQRDPDGRRQQPARSAARTTTCGTGAGDPWAAGSAPSAGRANCCEQVGRRVRGHEVAAEVGDGRQGDRGALDRLGPSSGSGSHSRAVRRTSSRSPMRPASLMAAAKAVHGPGMSRSGRPRGCSAAARVRLAPMAGVPVDPSMAGCCPSSSLRLRERRRWP